MDIKMDIKMGIGALAKRTRCKVETIRYYEQTGLMPNPPRSSGGHRVYGDGHLKRLSFIRKARTLGFSMDNIKSLLALMEADHLSCGEVAEKAELHLKDVRQRIQALQNMEQTLSLTLADCHRGSNPECAIIDFFTQDADDD
ncbi:MAG: helix-turn-helix domain-containing protein [Magnetovibrio sp.]|nr:helix-turn-helix domain-containing protein [Magnetovibrio sp.]